MEIKRNYVTKEESAASGLGGGRGLKEERQRHFPNAISVSVPGLTGSSAAPGITRFSLQMESTLQTVLILEFGEHLGSGQRNNGFRNNAAVFPPETRTRFVKCLSI